MRVRSFGRWESRSRVSPVLIGEAGGAGIEHCVRQDVDAVEHQGLTQGRELLERRNRNRFGESFPQVLEQLVGGDLKVNERIGDTQMVVAQRADCVESATSPRWSPRTAGGALGGREHTPYPGVPGQRYIGDEGSRDQRSCGEPRQRKPSNSPVVDRTAARRTCLATDRAKRADAGPGARRGNRADPAPRPCAARAFRATPMFAAHLQLRPDRYGVAERT